MENDVDPRQAVTGGTLAPGTLLDHCRLGKCLGVGGMGEVYCAVREVLRTPAPSRSSARGGSDAAARLIREARMTCRIRHDDIVGVPDAGSTSDPGCPCIVMEHTAIPGEPRPGGDR